MSSLDNKALCVADTEPHGVRTVAAIGDRRTATPRRRYNFVANSHFLMTAAPATRHAKSKMRNLQPRRPALPANDISQAFFMFFLSCFCLDICFLMIYTFNPRVKFIFVNELPGNHKNLTIKN